MHGNPLRYTDPRGLPAAGSLHGQTIGGWGAGSLGAETGPSDPPIIAGGRYVGGGLGTYLDDRLFSSAFSPGVWPGDKGGEEWGRRTGVGAKEGRRRFHGVKQSFGGRGAENYGVNPETGEVYDPEGNVVGDLGDAKPK